jgi:hypothetical protein
MPKPILRDLRRNGSIREKESESFRRICMKETLVFLSLGSSLDLVRTAKLVLDEYFSLTGVYGVAAKFRNVTRNFIPFALSYARKKT